MDYRVLIRTCVSRTFPHRPQALGEQTISVLLLKRTLSSQCNAPYIAAASSHSLNQHALRIFFSFIKLHGTCPEIAPCAIRAASLPLVPARSPGQGPDPWVETQPPVGHPHLDMQLASQAFQVHREARTHLLPPAPHTSAVPSSSPLAHTRDFRVMHDAASAARLHFQLLINPVISTLQIDSAAPQSLHCDRSGPSHCLLSGLPALPLPPPPPLTKQAR